MSPRATAALVAAVAVLAGPGCGGDSADEPDPPPRPTETADPLPKLPPGWRPHVNGAGGFAFGVPRGWKATDSGISTLVRSFDRLVAVGITPDRTGEAVELPLDDFATQGALAIGGFEDELEPSDPRPFEHRYEAVTVQGGATEAKSGIEQRVELVVVRRDALVTFSAVIAANAERRSGPARRVAERLVTTLRSRPVAGAG